MAIRSRKSTRFFAPFAPLAPLAPLGAATAALLALLGGPTPAEATPRRGPAKVVEVLDQIEGNLKTSRYRHQTLVRPNRGEYFFDCSGMADWVLRRSAPLALRALGRPQGRRPLARDYFRHFSRIPPGHRRGPWYRVPDAASLRPGDLISWQRRRARRFRSKVTGHVAFVVSEPWPNPGAIPGFLVRVADASRYRHQDDSRAEGENGFGTGVLLLVTDPQGQPVGYGWAGSLTPPEWINPTDVALGRPLR